MTGGPVTATNDGILLSVRLTPKARQAVIGDIALDANGAASLRVSVSAPPEDGKANAALIALLAKSWKLSKSRIKLVSGAASRNKKLRITGDATMLANDIEQRIDGKHD
jgi:uncharacterized protein (TIGR00251 family)